ncbi:MULTISPECIES: hypothetical protein [unclassified Polaribacter]|uniref:hypothetical protein n=1 Tax=unclassified Polaribacter TaxID=196858 RepID=UPI0011BD5230|nr:MULTISPECIES: hypothetical protein [unclassified Polaribacter]TXD53595.1 hypothetical protein ES043_02930 [Polaribacter sp. IC063]TXD62164.1 hypothetical protein ES044_02775 [Polaribacter sp. IC066]
MKINLKTKSIYTDNGELIKKLNCKHNITENDLKEENKAIIGNCIHCLKGVYKTENLTDEKLKNLVKKNPSICFYIKRNQANVSRIEIGELLYFKNISGATTIQCFDCGFESKSFITNLRTESNKPCQCQECGEIYENLKEATCSHKNISAIEPIFCKKCNSTNVKIGELIMG